MFDDPPLPGASAEAILGVASGDGEQRMSRGTGFERVGPWARHAACAGLTDLMFVGELGPLEEAKEVCELCSVQIPCLDWALSSRFDPCPHAVLGGLSGRERQRLRKMLATEVKAR